MLNNKIILGVLVGITTFSLVGVYLGINNSSITEGVFFSLSQRIDKEVQRLNKRTSPNVTVGAPVGYVITFENGAKFYISGDTAASADMKLVIGDYYKPDVAVLTAGGFFTMGPEEAAFATSLIRPKYVIPYHYGSYPMLMQDPQEFLNALQRYNLASQPVIFEVGGEKEIMGVKMTWLGHASWLLVSPEGKKILIDPATQHGFLSEKYEDFSVFGKVDLVFLTHGHPDHTSPSDLNQLSKLYKPLIIVPFELGEWLREYVINPELIYSLFVSGGSLSQNELAKVGLPVEKIGNIKFTPVSASHTSSVISQ